ncbi:hypothetical protein GCM10009544_23730 [Streptomyces stramineus]|uniref:Uncharacterized protein n=1 Tax=Streptomyces stramineus TaxID=173861 RepID=A0ABN0ZVI3_9ACTN
MASTWAPPAAKARAVARPIPVPAPVTAMILWGCGVVLVFMPTSFNLAASGKVKRGPAGPGLWGHRARPAAPARPARVRGGRCGGARA